MKVIEFIKRDQFEYKFHAAHHLLIMSERTSRDDGETLVDGLPISTARDFGRKLTLVPGRPPALRLAKASCADACHLFLHRSAQHFARQRRLSR